MSAETVTATEDSDREVPPDDEESVGDTSETRTADTVTVVEETDTDHWRGVGIVALLGAGAGAVFSSPALVLAATVAVGFLGYSNLLSAPSLELTVERELDDVDPDPGDTVAVTVRVRNDGNRTLTDLRLIDGVPESLAVVEGTARAGAALRPGATTAFTYAIRARRGEYDFEDLTVLARDPSGAREVECTVSVGSHVSCTPSLSTVPNVPVRKLTSQYTGRVDTDTGGEGIEFYSTREYRPGDSPSRVDWNRYAQTGELSTLTFREERMATVVLLLDLREDAYRQSSAKGLHAVDRSVDAAGRLFTSLLDDGDRVGIAGLAPEDVWLPPGTGNDHRARAQELLATHPALSPDPPERYFSTELRLRRLRQRLPEDAQVVILSPLADDGIVRTARLLDAHGHLVTVVSPDATERETAGQALGRAERRNRASSLREVGIRVVDWSSDESLATALARASARWSG